MKSIKLILIGLLVVTISSCSFLKKVQNVSTNCDMYLTQALAYGDSASIYIDKDITKFLNYSDLSINTFNEYIKCAKATTDTTMVTSITEIINRTQKLRSITVSAYDIKNGQNNTGKVRTMLNSN